MKAWEKKAIISTWIRDGDEYTLSKSAAIWGLFWMEPGVPVVVGGVKKDSGEMRSSSLVSNKSDDTLRWVSWIQDDTGSWEMGTTSGLEGRNSGSGGVEASSSGNELDNSDTAAWLLDPPSFWDMDAGPLTCNQSPDSLECRGYLGSSRSIPISVGTGFQFPIFWLSCHKSIRCFQPTRLLTITDDSHSGVVTVGMRVCSTLGSVTLRTCKSSFFLSGESDCELRNNWLILVDSDKMLLKKIIQKASIKPFQLLLTLRATITAKPITTLIPARLRPRAAVAATASVSIKPCGIFIQTLEGGRFESVDFDRSNRHEEWGLHEDKREKFVITHVSVGELSDKSLIDLSSTDLIIRRTYSASSPSIPWAQSQ